MALAPIEERLCSVMNAEVISQCVMVELYEDSNLVGSRCDGGIVDFTVASVHLHFALLMCIDCSEWVLLVNLCNANGSGRV